MSDERKRISVRVPDDLLELVKADMRRKGYNSITDYVLYALSTAASNNAAAEKSNSFSADLANAKEELSKKLEQIAVQHCTSSYVLMAMINMLCNNTLTSEQATNIVKTAFTEAHKNDCSADGIYSYIMKTNKFKPAPNKNAISSNNCGNATHTDDLADENVANLDGNQFAVWLVTLALNNVPEAKALLVKLAADGLANAECNNKRTNDTTKEKG